MNIIKIKRYRELLKQNAERISEELYLNHEIDFEKYINNVIENSVNCHDKWCEIDVGIMLMEIKDHNMKVKDRNTDGISYEEKMIIERIIASKIFKDIKRKLNVYKISKTIFIVRVSNDFFNIINTPLYITIHKIMELYEYI